MMDSNPRSWTCPKRRLESTRHLFVLSNEPSSGKGRGRTRRDQDNATTRVGEGIAESRAGARGNRRGAPDHDRCTAREAGTNRGADRDRGAAFAVLRPTDSNRRVVSGPD
jgi:hypothetical protein